MTDADKVYSLMKRFCALEKGNPERVQIMLDVKQIIDFPTKPKADGFDEFWKAYPHKVAKGSAEKAWPKARKEAPLEVILSGVEWYKRNKPDDCPFAHPATWLNAKRWLDGQHVPEKERDLSIYPEWKRKLVKELGEAAVASWFSSAILDGQTLFAGDVMKARWIRERYSQTLRMMGVLEVA